VNLEDNCGLCLEPYNDREIIVFPCLNHVIHKDCHKLWWDAEKNKSKED